jgi:hypothetical protein
MKQNVSDFYMIAVWRAEQYRKVLQGLLVQLLNPAISEIRLPDIREMQKKIEEVLRETDDD